MFLESCYMSNLFLFRNDYVNNSENVGINVLFLTTYSKPQRIMGWQFKICLTFEKSFFIPNLYFSYCNSSLLPSSLSQWILLLLTNLLYLLEWLKYSASSHDSVCWTKVRSVGGETVWLVRKHRIRLPGFRSELSTCLCADKPLHDDDDDGESDGKRLYNLGTRKWRALIQHMLNILSSKC